MLHHRRDVFLSLGAAILGSACQTAVPLIARQIVDNVILRHRSPLWPWLVLLVALAVAIFAFSYIRRYRGGRVALCVQYEMRNAMHDHLQAMDLATLNRLPTGQLVSRANSDSTLVQGLLSFFPIMSGNVLLLVLSLAVMIALSPLLAIVSILVVPALFVVSYRMRQKIFPATWDAQQREGDVAQIVDEDVNGVRIVKAFGQESHELGRIVEVAKKLYGSQMRAVRLQARYQPLLEAVPSIGQVAILAIGGWLALNGHLTLGTFLAFSTYVAQFLAPARQLAGVLTIAQQAKAGVERIFQLLDLAPAIADAPDAVDLPQLRGEVAFSNVTFGYDKAAPVLSGFDLRIAAGERVAIVGSSGSGKSTVATLVSRLHDPDAGTVLVDGHDVRTVTRRSLRRQVSFAFEDSFLFSDTVWANIVYGRPNATREDVEAAAQAAQAHGFIEELPNGYDTLVGERGSTLSGGQRQRIALARAILADPRILILDDATSAIDATTEEAIHDALRSVLAKRTTLLIAHRRSTLQLADRIVVLEKGRVIADGSHENLVQSSPYYRTMLSGLDEQAGAQTGDRIEDLAGVEPLGHSRGTTAAAWVPRAREGQMSRASTVVVGAPSIGPGLGGGGGRGGGGGWRRSLAPTPQLLAQVAALGPVRDVAMVDVESESRRDSGFTLARLLNEFRRPLLVGLILVILDALAGLAGPFLIKTGIDNGVSAGSELVLFVASGLFLVITLADLVNEIAETFITGRAAQRIMLSLRIRIWAQLQRLSLDYYEREGAGRIMTRMTTDVDQFEALIENGLLSALVAFVTFAGVGVALVLINLELGLYTLALVAVLAVATVIFRKRAERLYDLARDRVAIVNADFQESLSGVREAQSFTHEDQTKKRFHRLGADYLDTRVAAQRLVATYFPFVQFLAACADAVALGVGAGLIGAGHLTSGALIAFLLYLDMFFSPIQQLSQVFDSWQQTRVSVGRISGLMKLSTLTPDAEHPVDPGRLNGEITFQDVRFSYPAAVYQPGKAGRRGAEPRGPADSRLPHSSGRARAKPPESLRGIHLTVSAGETIALVGETGAGKSTIMKLIARFYDPDSGSIKVDGHQLGSLHAPTFRHQLGYVPQEPFLFTGSIRHNIAYGRPEATDAEVEAAARAVGAHDFIAELPGGYLDELSERGRSLSAGQRQLIALARAELVNPAILLLDEATANLDLVTEAHVLSAMHRITQHRTTILIAHRLQTARSAGRIAVVHAGRVCEIGSHDELLALGGRYAAMWETFELVGQDNTRQDRGPFSRCPPSQAG
jgi:ATP-binding cassette subfamily B protein